MPEPHRRGARFLSAVMLMAAVFAAAGPVATAQQRFDLTDAGWRSAPAGQTDPAVTQVRDLVAGGQAADLKAAVKAADTWIDSADAAGSTDGALPAMLLARGDALVARGKLWKALYDYERLLNEYPSSPLYLDAVAREFEIAEQFIDGFKRKLLGFRIIPTDGEGEELLIRVQERAPGTDLAERAAIRLADYYYDKQQMVLSAEAYDLFLENHPDSDRREHAMLRLIQANLSRFRGPAFDATGLIEAQERLRVYADNYPASAERLGVSALDQRIRESLAARQLESAGWYRRRGDDVAARTLYDRVIDAYPGTEAARLAAQRRAEGGAE